MFWQSQSQDFARFCARTTNTATMALPRTVWRAIQMWNNAVCITSGYNTPAQSFDNFKLCKLVFINISNCLHVCVDSMWKNVVTWFCAGPCSYEVKRENISNTKGCLCAADFGKRDLKCFVTVIVELTLTILATETRQCCFVAEIGGFVSRWTQEVEMQEINLHVCRFVFAITSGALW